LKAFHTYYLHSSSILYCNDNPKADIDDKDASKNDVIKMKTNDDNNDDDFNR
jgi:hypothetical protein